MVRLSVDVGTAMSTDEAASMLESTGHGVLSMGAADRGYGVPLSFAYERSRDRLVLQFVNGPDSKKQRFADATAEVTMTVYRYEDADRWASVIVTGSLHALDPEAVSDRVGSLFFSRADDTDGELRWVDRDDIEREWYELRIESITGRYSGALPSE
jgi:nitroimidazol reductase NimA-like FMN-containing flavoprotein (pyridoxamine 5'-phosphate oxidase superfamily)